MVSWNSNNHSSSDRVEWIMSWGVAGGPRHRTRSSLRRGGDLPWERSGEYSMCRNSAESGNRYRCKPPRAPTSLTQSGYWVYKFFIELYAINDISNCEVYWCCFFQLAYPSCLYCLLLHIIPLQWSPMFGGSRAETRWRCPLLSRSWSLARSAHYSLDFYCIFWGFGCSLASFLPTLTWCICVHRCSSVEDCTRYIYTMCV